MPLTLTNSRSWLERARKVLACEGAQTLSKGHTRNPTEYPIYIDRGKGSQVWDIDGNQFTDYMAALGPVILGYEYQPVTDAIIEQLMKGVLFSLESPLVVEVAEMLTELIPGAESVRFVKSGSDAVSAAVRAARTYTGRDMVLVASNSYHGCHNWFQVTQKGRGEYGVPKNEAANIRQFEYNDFNDLRLTLEHCRDAGKPVAAVVIEPARDFMATPEFLRTARTLCSEHGAIVIWDQVVTFGRLQALDKTPLFGVNPDLNCLGKAMANGMPLGCVTGYRAIMNAFDKCFISGTYNGELASLAAAKATLNILRNEPVAAHIWRQGERLMAGFNGAMNRHDVPGKAEGIPPCWRQTFTGPRAQELKMAFMSLCAERGILPGGITYCGYSHSDEDIRKTVQVYYQVAAELEKLLETPREVM